MTQIYNSNYTPLTQEEAEKVTALACREIAADEERSFLRCQIGTLRTVKRSAPVYVLQAHGATWGEAYKMWRKRKLSSL